MAFCYSSSVVFFSTFCFSSFQFFIVNVNFITEKGKPFRSVFPNGSKTLAKVEWSG